MDQRLVVIGIEIERLAVVAARPPPGCRRRRAPGPADRTPSADGPCSRRCCLAAAARLRRSVPDRRAARPRRAPGSALGRRRRRRRGALRGAPARRPASRPAARRRRGGASCRTRRRPASARGAAPPCETRRPAASSPRRSRGSSSRPVSAGPTNSTPVGVSRRFSTPMARSCVGAVEVDQQVAAEDDVVDVRARQEIGGEQVALLKLHLPAHARRSGDSPSRRRVEVAVAERQVAAAKRVLPVHAAPRAAPARAR